MQDNSRLLSAKGSAKARANEKANRIAAPKKHRRSRWGDWRYDPNLFTLTYLPYGYEVELGTCANSAEILDWIAHVAGKGWGTKCVGTFVLALDELLHLQANVCSGAVDHHFDPELWLRMGGAQ